MSFLGLHTGLSGVRAGQTAIDVAANNIANSSTPGYTRQRVDLTNRPSYTSLAGQVGTGVDVQSISRLRDSFLDGRARSASADAAAKGTRAELLGRMEDLTGEPDNGIATRLNALWSAAETWSNDPADTASRRQVLTELASVSETFRSTATQWDTLEQDVTAQRTDLTAQANEALQQLHDLDRRIANADPSRVGSEVFDQRDLLLDDVARLTGATVGIGTDGRSQVRLGDTDLVSEAGAGSLTFDADGTLTVTAADGTATAHLPADAPNAIGGHLGGLTRVLESDLPTWRGELDALATDLADAINGANAAGIRADGTPGEPLLGGDSAATLRLVDGTGPADLAAAAATDSDGVPYDVDNLPPPHDASNARGFADLRTDPAAGQDRTIDDRLADLTTTLAGEVRSARAAGDAARAINGQAGLARSAEHSVSIDEEMVALVQHQRALEAASRVMTTVDEALDVLINRTGVVGR